MGQLDSFGNKAPVQSQILNNPLQIVTMRINKKLYNKNAFHWSRQLIRPRTRGINTQILGMRHLSSFFVTDHLTLVSVYSPLSSLSSIILSF
jgi:hypothetical protein